jgi:hypothetical protein
MTYTLQLLDAEGVIIDTAAFSSAKRARLDFAAAVSTMRTSAHPEIAEVRLLRNDLIIATAVR